MIGITFFHIKRLKGLFIKAIKIQDYNVVNYSSIDPDEIFKNI